MDTCLPVGREFQISVQSLMKEKFYIYALISSIDSRIYVGFTKDIEKRLMEHNSGNTISTKGYRPWSLLFVEELIGTREDARKKEKYYKSGIGKEKLKKMVP
jgi:putative endonuclease